MTICAHKTKVVIQNIYIKRMDGMSFLFLRNGVDKLFTVGRHIDRKRKLFPLQVLNV